MDNKLLEMFDEMEALENMPVDKTKEYQKVILISLSSDAVYAQSNILDFRNEIEDKFHIPGVLQRRNAIFTGKQKLLHWQRH